jgi:hypothetical protein
MMARKDEYVWMLALARFAAPPEKQIHPKRIPECDLIWIAIIRIKTLLPIHTNLDLYLIKRLGQLLRNYVTFGLN